MDGKLSKEFLKPLPSFLRSLPGSMREVIWPSQMAKYSVHQLQSLWTRPREGTLCIGPNTGCDSMIYNKKYMFSLHLLFLAHSFQNPWNFLSIEQWERLVIMFGL